MSKYKKSNKKSHLPEKVDTKKKAFPSEYPFWARLKFGKRRTTLVIDEGMAKNKKTGKMVDGYVHREATGSFKSEYEEIHPNPDSSKPGSMYLKRPKATPKVLLKPHEKDLSMPDDLKKRYEKNNHKKE